MSKRIAIVALVAALHVGSAGAAAGNYTIVGGTPYEQQQIRQALKVSTFDWSLVPLPVTIYVRAGLNFSYSTPGQITLDAGLLDTGQFSWGVVQMEYGQQVQMTLLNDAQRAKLVTDLGAQEWCYEYPYLPKGDNACERFAAMVAWAYWQSPDNCMAPAGRDDWSASMPPVAFRALVNGMLGIGGERPTPPVSRSSRIIVLRFLSSG